MSTALSKAILLRLVEKKGSGRDAQSTYTPDPNGAFAVQFNPTSLRLNRQNNVDRGGATTTTQRRQNPSSQSATLSFDLEFDSAEGDENGKPQDVRDRTLIVRQFAEPSKEKPKDPPPPVRFIWGTFSFSGIVTSLSEDLDYFSPEGRPLRAKVSVTITEQNPDWEAKKLGGGALDATNAAPPGGGGANTGPGASPTANPVSAALAQAGESLQQLLTRLNADPATWRAAMAGLDSPLGLSAGAQVQLGAQVSAGVGLGVSAGFTAGASVGATAAVGAALGISAGVSAGVSAGGGLSVGGGVSGGAGVSAGISGSAGLSAGVGVSAGAGAGFSAGAGFAAGGSAQQQAGFLLAEQGGVSVAATAVAISTAATATAAARASFDVPPAQVTVSARLDPRTQSYGRGIPLRAQVELLP